MLSPKRVLISTLLAIAFWPSASIAQQWADSGEAVRADIRQFSPDVYGDYLTDQSMALADALVEAIGGPPDPGEIMLADGRLIYSGCRQHSCDEKAAALLDGNELQAMALIHFNCSSRRYEMTGDACLDIPMLTIVLRSPTDVAARTLLTDWARSKRADIQTVEVIGG